MKLTYISCILSVIILSCNKVEIESDEIIKVPRKAPKYEIIDNPLSVKTFVDSYYQNSQNALWLVQGGFENKSEGVRILRKNNSGLGFQEVHKNIDNFLGLQLEMASSLTGYFLAAGEGPLINLYKTIDGGTKWQKVYQNSRLIKDLAVLDENTLFMMHPVDNIFVAEDNAVYQSKDGGQTWFVSIPSFPSIIPENIFFFNKNLGFVTYFDNRLIKKTIDGGLTWQNIYLPLSYNSIADMWFFDQNNGLAVVGNTILRTQDGGSNWTITTATNHGREFSKLFFYPDGRGIIFGDDVALYYSRDFGNTIKMFLNTNIGLVKRIIPLNDTTIIFPVNEAVYKLTFPIK